MSEPIWMDCDDLPEQPGEQWWSDSPGLLERLWQVAERLWGLLVAGAAR